MGYLKNIARIFILGPLSIIYGTIVGIRNILFNIKVLSSKEFNVPVISIGNITVGGTGKTPHTEILIKSLRKEFRVACLSRGYKRKSRGFILATEKSTARQIGDEPMQIKTKFPDVMVAVDKKRCRGIEKLMSLENPPEIIILDDAYQHRYVKPDISILLSDYNRPFYEDFIMPYGRLRESRRSKYRANIIVVTKCPEAITPIERRIIGKNIDIRPYQQLYFTRMDYGQLTPVFPEAESPEVQHPVDYSVLMITGIANPEPLRQQLSKTYKEVFNITYPDHYNFTQNDIKNICDRFYKIANENKIIITTEKDAMRLKMYEFSEEIKNRIYYLPIESVFLHDEGEDYINQIAKYVRKNKGMF